MMFYFLLAQSQAGPQDINFGMLVLRMLIFLALIIVLIYFVLRKALPYLAGMQGIRNRTVKVLERLPLDQKRSLLVVEVQEKAYLLGVAEGQINVLMELDRDKIQIQSVTKSQTMPSFDQILKKTFLRSQPPNPTE